MNRKHLVLLIMLLCSSIAASQEIYCNAYGNRDNTPLIFIHGGPGYNSFTFEASTAKKLAEKGFYVVVYDQRGCGRSSAGPESKFSFVEAADDLLKIYQNFELKTAILLGHSFGGNIGIIFTRMYPEKVQALILAGTPLCYQQTFRGIIDKCEQIYRASQSPQLKYIEMIKNMSPDSLEYSSYCFMHAISCGLYTPKTITENAAAINKLIKEMDKDGLASHSTREPVQGFYNSEKHTTLNQSEALKKLREQKSVSGIYGLEDGLFDKQHLKMLEDSLGKANLTLVKDASHNVFIDQQELFINAVEIIKHSHGR